MNSRTWASAWLAALVAACGGGGGGGGETPTTSNLALTVAAPADSVPAGATTNFTLTLSNAGPAAASGVRIAPNLGHGLTLGAVRCTAAGGAACPGDAAAPLAWSSLPAGGVLTLQAEVGVSDSLLGEVSSIVAATAANEGAPSDNVATALLRVYAADVVVSGVGPTQPVAAGRVATYTMTVGNAGPDTARQVAIANTVGNAQTLGTMTCSATGSATCPNVLGPAMVVPLLPRGGTLVFTVPATVAANTAGSVANVMTATAAGDPQAANNAATALASAFVVPPVVTTEVKLRSDPGDYIGAGRNYVYTQADAVITGVVYEDGNRLNLQVQGDQLWSADFVLPAGQTRFAPGAYANVSRYPFQDPARPAMAWYGDGRACNEVSGSFTVNSVVYQAGQLSTIDLDFEQHCGTVAPALHGHVVWSAGDPTMPPGPVLPLPANLWVPAVAMPATGNYVYLESDRLDPIGGGILKTYTGANALLNFSTVGKGAAIYVTGNERWSGNFQPMASLQQLQVGYYGNLARYPFQNNARGGLDWSGEGRACNNLSGWFVVDAVAYADGQLTSLDLRFEQHCERAAAALHGKIHWAAGDTTQPPGPANPPPAGLWTPPAAALPASGNYVYLESQPTEYIVQGQTLVLTPPADAVTVSSNGRLLTVGTAIGYYGKFDGMYSLQQLQLGYYSDVQSYPGHNPAIGGLDWSGQSRACGAVAGWFVIDSITYVAGAVTAVDLRFEQHCDGQAPALRGAVHWVQ